MAEFEKRDGLGIEISINLETYNSVDTRIKSLLEKLSKANSLNFGIDESAIKLLEKQYNDLKVKLNKSLSDLKIFDKDSLVKDGAEIFRTLDEVKKKYQDLNKDNSLSFTSIFKDANEEIQKFTLQIKNAKGTIENLNFKGIKVADNSKQGFHVEYLLNSIREVNKANESMDEAISKTIQNRNKLEKEISLNQSQAINKAFDESYNKIVNFQNKQKAVLENLGYNFKGIVNEGDIANLVNELDKLSPVSKTVEGDIESLNRKINNLKRDLTANKAMNNIGQVIPTVRGEANVNSSRAEIEKYIKSVLGAKAEISSLSGVITKNGQNFKEVGVRVKESGDKLHKYKITLTDVNESNRQYDKGMQDIVNRNISFSEKLKASISSLGAFVTSATILYQTINRLKDAYSFLNDVNKEQTTIMMVTNMNKEASGELMETYNRMSKTLGDTTLNLAKASTEYFRQGKTIEETNEMIKASIIESKLAGIDSAQATEYLTSTLNGYRLEATQVMSVVDKMVSIDNVASTSVAELSEALSRTASSADLAGVSLDKILSYIGTVSSVSRKSASSIGENFKTIFARMNDIKLNKLDEDGVGISDVENVLNKIGIALRDSQNSFRNTGDVIDEVAKKWGNLSDLEQSAVAKSIAGTRQRENFIILMQNYEKALELEKVALNSNGISHERYGKYLESTEAKLNILRSVWESTYMSIANSDMINNAIGYITNLVETLNMLITTSQKSGIALIGFSVTSLVLVKNAFSVFKALSQMQQGLTTLSTMDVLIKALTGTTITFTGALSGLKAGMMALFTTPQGLAFLALATAIGVATTAIISHINKQRNLKQEIEKTKNTIDDLSQAMKNLDESGLQTGIASLEEKQKKIDELYRKRKALEIELNKTPEELFNTYGTDAIAKINNTIEVLDKNIKKEIDNYKQLGLSVDEATGKVVELVQAKADLDSVRQAKEIQKESEEINKLTEEYVNLASSQNLNEQQRNRLNVLSDQLKDKEKLLGINLIYSADGARLSADETRKRLEVLNNEYFTVGQVANAEYQSAYDRMQIQVGLTNITVEQAKKRVAAYRAEIEAASYVSNYVDAKTMQAIVALDKFNDIMKSLGGNNSLPKPNYNGGSYIPSDTGKSSKETSDLTFQLSLYRDIEKAISDIGYALDRNKQKQENATGQELINLRKEEIALLEKQKNAYDDLWRAKVNRRDSIRTELANGDFTFDDLGNITNLNQNLKIWEDWANSKTGTDKEKAIERTKKLEEATKEYLELISKGIPDANKQWYELANSIIKVGSEVTKLEIQAKDKELEGISKPYTNRDKDLDLIGKQHDDIFSKIGISSEKLAIAKAEVKQLEDYLDKLNQIVPETVEGQEELTKKIEDTWDALRDKKGEVADREKSFKSLQDEAISIVEKTQNQITDIIKRQVEKRKKLIDDEYNKKKEALQKERDLYNKQNDSDDYNKQLKKEQSILNEIKSKIASASMDTSLAGQARLRDLKQQELEQQEKIDDLILDRTRKTNNDKFDEQEKLIDKQKESQIKMLDELYSGERINKMASEAILKGYFKGINGEIINVVTEFNKFEDEFGSGISTISDKLKNEFIAGLKEAQSILKGLGGIDILFGETPKVQGSFKDGGKVEYTGLAMVHGSKNNPELMLNGKQAIDLIHSMAINPFNNIKKMNIPEVNGQLNKNSQVNFTEPFIVIQGNVTEEVFPRVERMVNNAKSEIFKAFRKGINDSGIYGA